MRYIMDTAYLLLKTAQSLFGKTPAALDATQLEKARGLAARQSELENRVLASEEARAVIVPAATLTRAIDEIRARYADDAAFLDDLAGNGLTPDAFSAALERELKVEAILDKVTSRAAKVSDIDVELYFHYHPEQFLRPETRRARHILVTVNEAYAENSRELARAKIEAIAERLAKDPSRFEEQALKHSECPTSLHGGLLGDVPRGKLFPELDACLFTLRAGQTSGILESEMGFHILRCEAIAPAGTLPFDQARELIRTHLEARRRELCRKAWLKSLRPAGVLA